MGPEPRLDFEFGPMEPGIPAVQTLGTIGSGFTGVSVTAMQKDGEAAPAFLTMRLRGGEPPQTVRERTIEVPRGPEFGTVHFDFEPIVDMPVMSLEIVALTSGDAKVFLGGTKNDRYPDGLLRYRDEPQFEDLDLGLNLYRHTTVWRLLTELRSRAVTGFVAAAGAGVTAVALVSVLAVWAAGSAIGSLRRGGPR